MPENVRDQDHAEEKPKRETPREERQPVAETRDKVLDDILAEDRFQSTDN